jgi:hypothetical protein
MEAATMFKPAAAAVTLSVGVLLARDGRRGVARQRGLLRGRVPRDTAG